MDNYLQNDVYLVLQLPLTSFYTLNERPKNVIIIIIKIDIDRKDPF